MFPELLFPDHPPEIFLGQLQETFQLAHPVLTDIPRTVGCAGLFKEADGFLVVCLCHVQGMLKRGLVLKGCVVVHATSLVPFPG